jgi:hypothetical protein
VCGRGGVGLVPGRGWPGRWMGLTGGQGGKRWVGSETEGGMNSCWYLPCGSESESRVVEGRGRMLGTEYEVSGRGRVERREVERERCFSAIGGNLQPRELGVKKWLMLSRPSSVINRLTRGDEQEGHCLPRSLV